MSLLTPHQSAALKTKGHLALTANAGSGKTFVLARKYLNTLIDDGLDISNVAAITFTEKAASELYHKISLLIEDRIKNSSDNKEKKQLERIRRQLVSANISTIHSFCLNILKDFPVEAKLDARFTPIDENLSSELIELSVEDTVRLAFDNKELIEIVKYLIRIFGSKGKLQNQIVRLIKNRKNVDKVKTEFYSDSIENIAERLHSLFDIEFEKIWNKSANKFIDSIKKINQAVLSSDNSNQIAKEIDSAILHLEQSNDVKSILINLNQLKIAAFTSTFTIKKRGYVNKELSEYLIKEIDNAEELIAEFGDFEILDDLNLVENELAKFGKNILQIYDKSLIAYEYRKKNEGYIDYEDILLHTKILLQNEDVQKQLAEKYKFIMVDEFQDTNEIQYQIFLPILDHLKKGKLFIVGDEKQSIYKFRDAEIEIFNLTRNDIKKNENENHLLSLPDSFRMAPAICAVCNHTFKNLFSEPDKDYGEVPATDLVCARVDDVEGKVEFLISTKNEEIVEDSEQELVAKKILQLISQNKYSFKDISILVRKRKNFSQLEKTFLKYQIPFAIIGGRGFYQRQIISDIHNYLSFLADTNNSTALVGILRSPFFTISDSQLFEISLKPGKSFWEKLNNVYDDKTTEFICKTLKENIVLSNSIGLSQLIEKIITDNNYLAIIANRNDGEQEIANIEKLISIARNFNSTGFRNLYDFLAYLSDSISNQSDEAQAGTSAGSNAIQMMTIHQSKGLEFPVVFICSVNESGMSSILKSGEIKIDKKFGLMAKVPIKNNYFEDYQSAPIVTLHNYYEEKKNIAELKRLLYVAMTRAKDELYITTEIEKDKKFKKDSFLKLLQTGLNNAFNSTEIIVNEKLHHLINIDSIYKNESKVINVTIPITSKIEFETTSKTEDNYQFISPEVNLDLVSNREKGEIISASKVSIYSQCPLKYLLTYEHGYGKLSVKIKSNVSVKGKNKFILNDEDEESVDIALADNYTIINQSTNNGFDSALYGKLFHKAIELTLSLGDTEKYAAEELAQSWFSLEEKELFAAKLKSDLGLMYQSKTWKEILSFTKYRNEFEIYVKEKDYYLHGIIDKIIFSDKKVKIIDYKTDEIEKKEIKKHSEFYLMQLRFYLYIASRLFTEFDSFEGSLIFTKHPDHPVTITFTKEEIQILELEITEIINSIRNKNFEKKLSHCKVCSFSDSKFNCVIN